jgi:hypothetical protein
MMHSTFYWILVRSLLALSIATLTITGCSSTSSSSPSATSLADSLAGSWHGHEVAYSGYNRGYGGSRDTLDFAATITKVNDSVIGIANKVKYYNLPWHFESLLYTIHASARTLTIPTTSITGKIYSTDSLVVTGIDNERDSLTYWTGYYNRVQ